MHDSHFLRGWAAAAALALVVGCSASSPEPDVEVSSDALRALTRAEIVGDLQYGQTSPAVAYKEQPKYRAFRFQGRQGDAIDAWVRSANGDARAWLLDASFHNVVSNDNASASTRDSHLVTTLVRGGAYYIAFREATLEDASFTVSLNATTGSTCDPEEEDCPGVGGGSGAAPDPFDPASCAGPAMTKAQAIARFSAGATSAKLGDFAILQRKHWCNPLTGCVDWSAPETLLRGSASLSVIGQDIVPVLRGPDPAVVCGFGGTSSWNNGTTCSQIGGPLDCPTFGLGGFYGDNITCPTCPKECRLQSLGTGHLTGTATASCLRLDRSEAVRYDSLTKSYEYAQTVIVVRY